MDTVRITDGKITEHWNVVGMGELIDYYAADTSRD
jgi:predicted SnoaL-like aldol condensation-catalyzing enzyme